MDMTNDEWKSFLLFIRQYLALEEWFHAENDKEEVRQARQKIASVLNKLLQDLFPWGDGTHGYNIPKMHGMAKMQYFMFLFRCAINFFGGPGESSHKEFVKAPGMKTQRRISEFAVQTARQYHHVMVTKHVLTCMTMRNTALNAHATFNTVVMEGKYEIDISDSSWEYRWIHLHEDLVSFYAMNGKAICRHNGLGTKTITGYMRACCCGNGHQSIFYAHPCYHGSPWYDWAYVHYVDDNEDEAYNPAKILGFFGADGGVNAVVQCSLRPLNWSTLEKRMIVEFELGVNEESFVAVPLSSFVYTLCVIKDYGGGKNKYIVVLPRSGWGQYFGSDIK
jgi:hypothetical protein